MISKQDFQLKLVKALRSLKRKLSAKLYTMLLRLGFRPLHIYVLTTVSLDKEWGSKRSRCWAWFATQEDAIQSAIRSADFYSECGYYTHVVIEKNGIGWRYDMKPTWFELRRLKETVVEPYEMEDGSKGEFHIDYEAVEVVAPPQAKNIVGWGIG